MYSKSSRKYSRYDDALSARRWRREFGYKTGRIVKDWQGLYSFLYDGTRRK